MTEALLASPTLLDQRKEHVAGNAWRWVIHVGSIKLRHAETAEVSYDEDGAGALTLRAEVNLSGMARAPVRVFCGYGPGQLSEWFSGDLGKPYYDPETGVSEAEAYGVLGAMGRQYFDEAVTLQGITLRGFFGLVQSRLYDSRTRIEVKSGNLSIEDTAFPGENSLRESGEAVIEGFDHVMRERPGFGLIVTPRPRPAALARYSAVFTRADYPVGQPEIKPTEDGPWAKVVVYRRDENGVEVVRAEAEVAQSGPYRAKPNEIFWVPDFDGTQAEAQDVAPETARALAINSFKGQLTDISPREDLFQDEPILLKRVERENGKRYRREYASVITTASLDLVGSSMILSFDALRVRDEEIPERAVPDSPSPYARAAEGSEHETAFGEDSEGAYLRLGSSEDYTGEDGSGMWIDPTVSDEAGEDDGLWVEVSD